MLKKLTYLLILGIFSLGIISCDKTNTPEKPKDPTEESQNGGKDDKKDGNENQGGNEGENEGGNQGGNEGTGGDEGGNEGTGGNEGGNEGGDEGGDEGGNEGNGGDAGQLGYLDPEPTNVDFFHKVFVYKFTGLWCKYCPAATRAFREVKQSNLKDNVLFANIYLDDELTSTDANILSRAFNVRAVPSAFYNFYQQSLNSITASSVKSAINNELKEKAKAGVAAKVELVNDKIVVNALVKSNSTYKYKLGVWVLEDDIYGKQTSAFDDSYNYHHDVLRAVHRGPGNDFAGEQLGSLKSKDYANKTFEFSLNKDWKKEKCRVIVFVTYPKRGANLKEYDYVTNIITCKIGEEVKMQYNK